MSRVRGVSVVVLVMLASSSYAQLTHNITAVSIVAPPLGPRMSLGVPVKVTAQFQNTGIAAENNVRLIATFTISGTTVYRDTQYVDAWPSGEYHDVDFLDYTPTAAVKGPPLLCIFSELAGDQDTSDNSLCELRNARYEADLKAVSVSYPPKDTVIREGSLIRIKGRFANVGVRDFVDTRARLQIRNCSDRLLRFQVDSLIPELIRDSTVEFTFPFKNDTADIRNLRPGCYDVAVIALLSDDIDRTNDTARATMRIVDTSLTNNITGIEAIAPIDNSTGPASPGAVDLKFRFVNPGLHDLAQVPVTVSVSHQHRDVVYRDTFLSTFASVDYQIVTFDSFVIPHHTGLGWYTATAIVHLWNDGRRADDTIVTRFARGFARDVRTVAVLVPHDGQILTQGVTFFPKVLFDNVGLDTNVSVIPVNLRIYDCTTNQVVYERNETAWNKIMPVGYVYTFSSISDGFSTGQLPAGCYKIIVTALDELDKNLANDQVYSKFTIAAVAEVEERVNAMVTMYPNPTSGLATLGLTLADDGMVAMRLYDVLGNTTRIIEQTHYARGRHSVPLDLSHTPPGSYLYELTFTGQDGLTKRITKILTVAR